MLRGPLICIGLLTVGRAPMIFRRVTDDDFGCPGAPDSHRGPVFLVGPDGQRGPDCPDVLFCRFPHRFRDFYAGFGCFFRSFGPRGPGPPGARKSRGGAHTLSAPWIRPWFQTRQNTRNVSSDEPLPVKNTGRDFPFILHTLAGRG